MLVSGRPSSFIDILTPSLHEPRKFQRVIVSDLPTISSAFILSNNLVNIRFRQTLIIFPSFDEDIF